MPAIRKIEALRRLGFAPEDLQFLGQCYDCGEGQSRQCALTQKPTRFCFTLKPRSGKGRITIGPESFPIISRLSPELYLSLERGRHFLMLGVDATAAEMRKHSLLRASSATRRRVAALRGEARARVGIWKKTNLREQLPEILENLRLLMGTRQPKGQDPAEWDRWQEQLAADLEQGLLRAHADEAARGGRSYAPVAEIDL